MLVLGIESSCDETGIAIYDSQKGLIGHTLHILDFSSPVHASLYLRPLQKKGRWDTGHLQKED